jgi:very-short-patch-repair endonuclease
VDFVCLERRIIVELDGGQHADQETCDATRTAFLEAQGFRVLRFWNSRVIENRTGVCDEILAACGGEAPRVVMREQANVERFLARVDGG